MSDKVELESSASIQENSNLLCDEQIEERLSSELFNERMPSVLEFHRKYLVCFYHLHLVIKKNNFVD